MNLDDQERIRTLDRAGMLGTIGGLPKQLEWGFQAGMEFPLPAYNKIRNVIIAGMGSSAFGADLLANYSAQRCSVPVMVHRDYDLPVWAKSPETLVIACSYSGNTEETISAFSAALQNNCQVLSICTDGALEALSRKAGAPSWNFKKSIQSQSAVGISFGLLLAALVRIGLLPDPAKELREAGQVMEDQQAGLTAQTLVSRNPAKRMAGQLFGRWVSVLGSGYMAPVARRWKSQINQLAKAWAQYDFLPEADHNTFAGVVNPVDVITRTFTLFLRAPSDHPRNSLRATLTQQGFMIAGLNTDSYEARGMGPLAHIWSATQFGDFVAFYLAIAYGIDPTPVEAVEAMKAALRG